MYLFLSIIVSALLGYFLMALGPLFGGLIAFGIVVGCLFRGLFLLNEIYKTVSKKKDRVEVAFEKYLEERDQNK